MERTTEMVRTGVRHETNSMAHHTHLVQTGLPIEEHVAERDVNKPGEVRSTDHSLSVLQMPLDDPTILKESVLALVISQINSLSRVTNNETGSRILSRPIPYELL